MVSRKNHNLNALDGGEFCGKTQNMASEHSLTMGLSGGRIRILAGVVELADTLDLGSIAMRWVFYGFLDDFKARFKKRFARNLLCPG